MTKYHIFEKIYDKLNIGGLGINKHIYEWFLHKMKMYNFEDMKKILDN